MRFEEIVKRHPYAAFLHLGSTEDRAIEAENVVDLRGRDPRFVLEAIARSDLFVGNDSGPAWLAAATATPMLVLMDPERTARYPVGFLRLGLPKFVLEEPITRTPDEVDRLLLDQLFSPGRPRKGIESTPCLHCRWSPLNERLREGRVSGGWPVVPGTVVGPGSDVELAIVNRGQGAARHGGIICQRTAVDAGQYRGIVDHSAATGGRGSLSGEH